MNNTSSFVGALVLSTVAGMPLAMASDPGQTGSAWTKYYGNAQVAGTIDGKDDFSSDMLRDASGNVIVTGGWNSYAWGVVSARSVAHDFFIGKYDANGTQLWLKQLTTGQQHNDYGSALAMDSAGNIYVTGHTDGNTFEAPSAATTWVQNNFVAKYDANGNRLWIRYFGTTTADMAQKIAIDPNNNIYVAGYTADEGTTNYDPVLFRFDSSGNQIWRKKYNNTGYQEIPVGVVYDSYSASLVMGVNQWNPAATTYGAIDILLKRIALDGTYINEMKIASAAGGEDRIDAIAAGHGLVYIAGRAGQHAFGTIDPSNLQPNNMGLQYFVASVSPSQFYVNWADRLAYEDGAIQFRDIATDPLYRVHVTGNVGKNAPGNITGGAYDTSNWGNDIFYGLWKLGGERVTIDQMGAYGVRDDGAAIATDSVGNFYISGAVRGSMNGVTSAIAASISSSNMFITRNMPR